MSDSEAGRPEVEAAAGGRRPVLRLPDLPALRLGRVGKGLEPAEWLLWLFRAIAVFEVLKGLVHWAVLLCAGTSFFDTPLAFRAATVLFAALDPVAGVGMWLTSSWGAVLWLLAAVAQVALCLFVPAAFGHLWLLVAVEVAAIAAYVWLTLRIAAERDEV
jgi:hypothetical protein